jgi:hypothetical protein
MIIGAEQIRIGDIVEQHGVRHGWGIALGHQPIEVRRLRASARQLAA